MLTIHSCNLCPRQCGVDRRRQAGYCGVKGETVRVGRASLHLWEEPVISGENGSGTIFFAGCTLGCPYCQNYSLSHGCTGKDITVYDLAKVMLSLQRQGAHNINLVTPTHYSVHILQAAKIARDLGLLLPIVYNTSGYESEEAIGALRGTVDIFLTDLKYYNSALSELHIGIPDYFTAADKALRQRVEQTGTPVIRNNLMESGVIVRHLVLPGHIDDSKRVIRYLHDTYGGDILISIMNQYTPVRKMKEPMMNSVLPSEAYQEVIDFALSIGVTNAFIQEEGTQEESFIPEFNGEGVL